MFALPGMQERTCSFRACALLAESESGIPVLLTLSLALTLCICFLIQCRRGLWTIPITTLAKYLLLQDGNPRLVLMTWASRKRWALPPDTMDVCFIRRCTCLTNDLHTWMPQLHSILSRPEFATAVSWLPHGRAFKVHVPKEFEKNILPTYFGHGRWVVCNCVSWSSGTDIMFLVDHF